MADQVASGPPVIDELVIDSLESPKDTPSLPRSALDWMKRIGDVVLIIAAIATLTSIAVRVGFELFPGWKPPVPPNELAVAITDVALEERATAELRVIVSYRISFTGYKGDQIHIEWTALDPATLQRLPLAASVPRSTRHHDNGVADDVAADAEADRGRGRIEFPVPLTGDCIMLRVYAYDTRFNRLDYGDTVPFHPTDPSRRCESPIATPTP